jgi:hypothetical protein
MPYETGKYRGEYDKPAQAYEDRLASTSMEEEELAEDLWSRTRADTEAQHAQQTNLAYASLAGAGSGGAPERLRSATYAQGQVGQQHATDAAMLAALEDQAYRQQMMDILGRRGEYGMAGMEFATDQYVAAAQREAYERQKEEQRRLREAQETAETIGLVAGMAGAGIMGGM